MPRTGRVAESGEMCTRAPVSQLSRRGRAAGSSERSRCEDARSEGVHSRKEGRRIWRRVGERVVDVLSKAYRRESSWLQLARVGRSDRHQVWRPWLCSQAKEGTSESHDVCVWDRVAESGHSPAIHRQRLDAISRPVVFTSVAPSLAALHSINYTLFVASRTRQLYIGQRRARFTFSKGKRRPPTTQQARCGIPAPPHTVKGPV